MKSDFDLPTPREPLDDLLNGDLEIGAQQSLGLELFLWIAHDDPPNREGRLPARNQTAVAEVISILRSFSPYPSCAISRF